LGVKKPDRRWLGSLDSRKDRLPPKAPVMGDGRANLYTIVQTLTNAEKNMHWKIETYKNADKCGPPFLQLLTGATRTPLFPFFYQASSRLYSIIFIDVVRCGRSMIRFVKAVTNYRRKTVNLDMKYISE
jgi:hypothetical protein